jgi:dipeptidase E
MKLYLSSIGIHSPRALKSLIGKPLQDSRAAIIPNAKDYFSPASRAEKITEVVSTLGSFGMASFILDLKDYDDEQRLKGQFKDVDFIWVMGGNLFVLRYLMRKSGFENIVYEVLNKGAVYGGESGGSIVAGPSLKGFDFNGQGVAAPELILEGLNLVQSIIIPHADVEFFAKAIDSVRAQNRMGEMVALNDGQAAVYDESGLHVVDGEQ